MEKLGKMILTRSKAKDGTNYHLHIVEFNFNLC